MTQAELEQLKRDLAVSSGLAAQRELEGALDGVIAGIANGSRRFAAWEEVLQQFDIPHYYSYWRNHRMLNADVLAFDNYWYDVQGLLVEQRFSVCFMPVLITQLGIAERNLSQLRDMGFEIALDDFGSGYSSLRYLTGMPVDIVKFDILLVRCLQEASKRNIVLHLAQIIIESGQAIEGGGHAK